MNTSPWDQLQSPLIKRSKTSCELCLTTSELNPYAVISRSTINPEYYLYICNTCQSLLEEKPFAASPHWQCLEDQTQNNLIPLQIMICRILMKLETQQVAWAEDLLDELFFGIDILDLADEVFL